MKFITYEFALLFANIALLLILAAVSYYILINIAKVLRQNTGPNLLFALRRNKSNLQLRYQHRNMVAVFITTLIIHRLIS